MTTDPPALPASCAPPHDDLIQFVIRELRGPGASELLRRSRALLACAPPELAESFEQAMRLGRLSP